MIKFEQSQALTSHFESFWSIVCKLISRNIFSIIFFLFQAVIHRFMATGKLGIEDISDLPEPPMTSPHLERRSKKHSVSSGREMAMVPDQALMELQLVGHRSNPRLQDTIARDDLNEPSEEIVHSIADSEQDQHVDRAYGAEQSPPGRVEEASEVKESTPIETGIEPLVRKYSESSDNIKAR